MNADEDGTPWHEGWADEFLREHGWRDDPDQVAELLRKMDEMLRKMNEQHQQHYAGIREEITTNAREFLLAGLSNLEGVNEGVRKDVANFIDTAVGDIERLTLERDGLERRLARLETAFLLLAGGQLATALQASARPPG